ncbi:MAG: acyl transferase [Flavobacteriaceae bacterium]|nr:acyl transferase [Flavobacteriaceae bacterium]MBT4246238.1 acyl transferase [Flavobacteriaceae bacterium]MBT5857144.1 acyl transferase [Flavobacteriaceae bacterium]MBT7320555.1 acyl transferase [Flavobacteriaceae bacterium]
MKKKLDSLNISSQLDFKNKAITLFHEQFNKNFIYNQYCKLLKIKPNQVNELKHIPFIPIQFFKTHKIVCNNDKITHLFKSSGTGGSKSINYVSDINLYVKSFSKCFENFYGPIKDYIFLGLLPSYLEQKNSSLVYMINYFIKESKYNESEFYLNDYKKLNKVLIKLRKENKRIILFGVSYALLDFIEKYPINIRNLIVIETGGMKGRRIELTREELHSRLSKGFNVENIHSEYGMTELFSQAYSKQKGIFKNPPWMKTLIRDINNPFSVSNTGRGAINVIDLANINTCAFIASDDIGEIFDDFSFKINGRLSESEIRGCNLMFN